MLDRIDRKIQHAAKPCLRRPYGRRRGAKRPRRSAWLPCGLHEAMDLLEREIAMDYMRVRGFPFADDVRAFLESHETISWWNRTATPSCEA